MQWPMGLMSGPDTAGIRHAHARDWLDRAVSLESMNQHLKSRSSLALRQNCTEQ